VRADFWVYLVKCFVGLLDFGDGSVMILGCFGVIIRGPAVILFAWRSFEVKSC
jgi:hypothetical protein